MQQPRFDHFSQLNGGIRACVLLFLCVVSAIAASAQTFSTVFAFNGSNGEDPEYMTAIQGTDGNFYGTTSFGGAHERGTSLGGTVFKLTPEGQLSTLYNFCAQPSCADGELPFAGLVQGADGNFYGTTGGGGTSGFGTVFKVTPVGILTVLHSFNSTDGAQPRSPLFQATDGNFYGTTSGGGAHSDGTVFKITAAGALTTLYSFCAQKNCADGSAPIAGVVQGTDGNFYGTTGGLDNSDGTAFKLTAAGALTTLYTFCTVEDLDCPHGSYPSGGLVQGSDGNFYGTTYYGGPNGFGTVFKLTPAGKLTTLHTFVQTDGESPFAGLVQGSDGAFYGTTLIGGLTFSGAIYKITSTGVFTSLYSLNCESEFCPDGSNPYGGLLQSTDGTFYGTTFGNRGTIFNLNVGLNPFVETRPSSGKVGAAVRILGTDLTGTTSVTFNGVAAAFTVVSASEVRATVPAGASSGIVVVTTPGGTLSSNTRFRVTR
jgi:uncharacterized repeat protein (TIGR03803 family)